MEHSKIDDLLVCLITQEAHMQIEICFLYCDRKLIDMFRAMFHDDYYSTRVYILEYKKCTCTAISQRQPHRTRLFVDDWNGIGEYCWGSENGGFSDNVEYSNIEKWKT